MFRRIVAVGIAAAALSLAGSVQAQAYAPQDELRLLLMGDQGQSDAFKQLSIKLGRKTCADIDRNPGRKGVLIAFDRLHPGTNVGINGMTATEIDIMTYCPNHLLTP
ncbi:hypothetical protein [Nocardia sp. NPDC005978]|uniref:hypothetical protein n=1 Tax=unclassified Nocardia TaxID=2637762 RepID=UPI0033AB6E41